MGKKKNEELTVSMKEDLLRAYHRAGGMRYLLDIAHKDHRAFLTMLAKLVPTEVNATVTHNTIDLGAAMREAQRRLEQQTAGIQPKIIDITPEKEHISLDDLI